MRKRNVAILFRLNRKEAEALDKKVKKSGLSREAYLRHLISGVVPRDAPPPDYYSMMRELHRIGNNLNQIAQKAHTLNVVDVQRYDRDMRMFEDTIKKITEAVILPEPMKNENRRGVEGGYHIHLECERLAGESRDLCREPGQDHRPGDCKTSGI